MVRLHRGELTPRDAFAMAAGEPAEPATPPPAAYHPGAYLLRTVRESRGWQRVLAYLASRGIHPAPVSIEEYRQRWHASRDWITWGVKWTSKQYRRGGRNVLFLENALFGQSTGAYIDTGGYFADSGIVADREPPDHAEVAEVVRHAARVTGREWFCGGNPAGPVLVALQIPGDCAVRHAAYYPGRGAGNPNDATIATVARHLPGLPVVVRPHPRAGPDHGFTAPLPPGWRVDTAGTIHDALASCRALVTASSTAATDALAMGVPAACLGRSAWIGRGAVLECADDPARLASLPDWRPDEWATLCYLAAVLRRQLPYDGSRDPAEIAPLVEWADRVTGRREPETTAPAWQSGAEYIRQAGTDEDRTLLAAYEEQSAAAKCPACRRARMRRQIVALAAAVKKRMAGTT